MKVARARTGVESSAWHPVELPHPLIGMRLLSGKHFTNGTMIGVNVTVRGDEAVMRRALAELRVCGGVVTANHTLSAWVRRVGAVRTCGVRWADAPSVLVVVVPPFAHFAAITGTPGTLVLATGAVPALLLGDGSVELRVTAGVTAADSSDSIRRRS